MYLSAFITNQWLSAVLINDNPIEIVDSTFVKFPYKVRVADRVILQEDINKILEAEFKEYIKTINDVNPIFILNTTYPTDITSHKLVTDILPQIPLTIVDINQFDETLTDFVSDKYLNAFKNYTEYRFTLPKDIKLQVDLTYLTYYIKNNLDKLLGIQNIVITSPLKFSEIAIMDYIVNIVRQFANTIKIAGTFNFNIDYAYNLIPIVTALLELDVDIKQFFKDNPLAPDAKLIVAPGVEKYEVFSSTLHALDGKEKTETVNLRTNALNIIQLKENEEIKISYKSKASKFSGKITGSRTDVYFDNREFNLKK